MERARGGARLSTVCLSMYSITENIYYSQLCSVAILLQPEPNCFTSYNTRKWLCSLSLCAIVLQSPPASHVSTSNGQWSSHLFCVHYNYVLHSSSGRRQYAPPKRRYDSTLLHGATSQKTKETWLHFFGRLILVDFQRGDSRICITVGEKAPKL
jgi:hypothetical protein